LLAVCVQVGRVFEALEAARLRFGIADYAVAQPTLEQVFVRTVMEHSESERGAASRSQQGVPIPMDPIDRKAGPSLEDEATLATDFTTTSSSGDRAALTLGGPTLAAEVSSGGLRTECCGLNRRAHRFLATASGLLAFLMFLTMSGLLGPSE
jgi:hypothetical protein